MMTCNFRFYRHSVIVHERTEWQNLYLHSNNIAYTAVLCNFIQYTHTGRITVSNYEILRNFRHAGFKEVKKSEILTLFLTF